MLYITTRDDRDAHTAYKALHWNTASDGGLYVPFRLPVFSREETADLKNVSFGETVAKLLNLFFSAGLTGWDIDSCIGRTPVKIVPLNRKIFSAELWHNLESRYAYIENRLFSKLAPDVPSAPSWPRIAIHIAVLFGVYGCALQQDVLAPEQSFDVSVDVGDFTAPMAALYAKKMGLPVGNVVLCTQDNSALWDLINRAEMGTSILNPDRKLGAERLIHNIFGVDEVLRFHSACERHGVYTVSDEQLPVIGNGLFAAVVGEQRINTTINSIYRTNQYLTTPLGAICYAGLQDYRAKAGESCPTVLFIYDAPSTCQNTLHKATGLGFEDIVRLQNGG